MTTTVLTEHPNYSEAYFLLDELVAAKGLAISDTADSLLGEAVLELTNYGADAPSQAGLPLGLDPRRDLDGALQFLDQLLTRLLLDTSGLALGLRLTRVRDLVSQARRIA